MLLTLVYAAKASTPWRMDSSSCWSFDSLGVTPLMRQKASLNHVKASCAVIGIFATLACILACIIAFLCACLFVVLVVCRGWEKNPSS